MPRVKAATYGAQVKAAGEPDGLDAGQVEMIVAVFGNVDSYGDVVVPGAFTDSLAEWQSKGDPIPFVWSHDWSDPFSIIGAIQKAEERPEGLWVQAQLDLGNPKAVQVYNLLKARTITQASFAYDVLEAAEVKQDNQWVMELRKLDIFEAGPTLLGVNRETELLAVKAADVAKQVRAASEEQPQTPGDEPEVMAASGLSPGQLTAWAIVKDLVGPTYRRELS